MSAKISNIAKNTSYFTLALVLQKIISFTYFIIIARALGPEDLGKYYFAISFTAIFSIFIDLGFSSVLTREVAKDQPNANILFRNIFAFKLLLTLVSLSLVIALVNFLGYPELTRYLIYISSISMVLDSFTLTFFAVARGFHNLFYESVASVVFQLIVITTGIILLKLNKGLIWLMFALSLASVFNFFYSLIILKKKWKINILPRFDYELAVKLVKITIPFALYGIFQRIYTYLDSVLLSSLAGDKYVGLYQVSFKIMFALQFLPMAFVASLYPAMSTYWASNREQLSITFERAMNYLIIISLPVSIGIIALADKIVLIFKGGYTEAIIPLQISMAALVFYFLTFPVGSLLNACDRQKENTTNMGIVMISSVVLNLFLIPKFQAIGASITVLVTNILMFTLSMYLVPKITKYNYRRIFIMLFKCLIAVAAMGSMALLLKHNLNIALVIIISGFVYFVVLFLLGGYKKNDIVSIYQSFVKKGQISDL